MLFPGPVIEVQEEADSLSDSDDEQDPKFFDNNRDVTEETKVQLLHHRRSHHHETSSPFIPAINFISERKFNCAPYHLFLRDYPFKKTL